MMSSGLKWGALLSACLLTVGANACAADNCYRALFPCPSPSAVSVASAFCATVTANGVTATNFPTRATAACGTAPAKYISACKCGPTCSGPAPTPTATCTPTATAGVVNGDFECGLAPWTVQLPDSAATDSIVPTGYTSGHSFQIDFNPPSVANDQGVSARVLAAPVPVTPGVTYLLSFATWFKPGSEGFVGVKINGLPHQTVDAGDFGMDVWHVNKLAWTAKAGDTAAVPEFEFLVGPPATVSRIDAVSFVALASCDDGPWPGILPNGDFECGVGSWTVEVPDPAATAGVVEGGGFISGRVFEVDFHYPAVHTELGVSARVWSKLLPVTPGWTYKLTFYTWFSSGSDGFVGVRINEGAAGKTVDAQDHYPLGVYHANELLWTVPAGVTTATVKFEFLFGATSVNRIDGITFQPV